jgi:hypothetical protein
VGIAPRLQLGSDTFEAKEKVRAPKDAKIVQFSDAGQREATLSSPMIVRTDAELRQQ